MNDCFKCCLFSMGLGLGIGLYVGATNKKVQTGTKKAKEMALEKLNQAKEKIGDIADDMQENQESEQESSAKNKQNKSSSSK